MVLMLSFDRPISRKKARSTQPMLTRAYLHVAIRQTINMQHSHLGNCPYLIDARRQPELVLGSSAFALLELAGLLKLLPFAHPSSGFGGAHLARLLRPPRGRVSIDSEWGHHPSRHLPIGFVIWCQPITHPLQALLYDYPDCDRHIPAKNAVRYELLTISCESTHG